tara:strand:+ start:832 stop:1044 length:213 start_codon:yes stop_codon:yes gene_type:complete
MSLQGQAAKSYTNLMNKSMSNAPDVEEPATTGLMNRSRPVKKEDKPLDSQGFLMEQFTQLQKLRAGLKNG